MNGKGILIIFGLVLAALALVFWLTYWAWTLVGLDSSQALGANIILWFLTSGVSFNRKSKS